MAGKKKKTYMVKCIVNMCAEHEEKVIVKATKPSVACQKAMEKLKGQGHFHASVVWCIETKEAQNEKK